MKIKLERRLFRLFGDGGHPHASATRKKNENKKTKYRTKLKINNISIKFIAALIFFLCVANGHFFSFFEIVNIGRHFIWCHVIAFSVSHRPWIVSVLAWNWIKLHLKTLKIFFCKQSSTWCYDSLNTCVWIVIDRLYHSEHLSVVQDPQANVERQSSMTILVPM